MTKKKMNNFVCCIGIATAGVICLTGTEINCDQMSAASALKISISRSRMDTHRNRPVAEGTLLEEDHSPDPNFSLLTKLADEKDLFQLVLEHIELDENKKVNLLNRTSSLRMSSRKFWRDSEASDAISDNRISEIYETYGYGVLNLPNEMEEWVKAKKLSYDDMKLIDMYTRIFIVNKYNMMYMESDKVRVKSLNELKKFHLRKLALAHSANLTLFPSLLKAEKGDEVTARLLKTRIIYNLEKVSMSMSEMPLDKLSTESPNLFKKLQRFSDKEFDDLVFQAFISRIVKNTFGDNNAAISDEVIQLISETNEYRYIKLYTDKREPLEKLRKISDSDLNTERTILARMRNLFTYVKDTVDKLTEVMDSKVLEIQES